MIVMGVKTRDKETNVERSHHTVIPAYRTIWKRDRASHLRPAITIRRWHTIFTSAYHSLKKI